MAHNQGRDGLGDSHLYRDAQWRAKWKVDKMGPSHQIGSQLAGTIKPDLISTPRNAANQRHHERLQKVRYDGVPGALSDVGKR